MMMLGQVVRRLVAGMDTGSRVRIIVAIVVPFGWLVLFTSPTGLAAVHRLTTWWAQMWSPQLPRRSELPGKPGALLETPTAS